MTESVAPMDLLYRGSRVFTIYTPADESMCDRNSRVKFLVQMPESLLIKAIMYFLSVSWCLGFSEHNLYYIRQELPGKAVHYGREDPVSLHWAGNIHHGRMLQIITT